MVPVSQTCCASAIVSQIIRVQSRGCRERGDRFQCNHNIFLGSGAFWAAQVDCLAQMFDSLLCFSIVTSLSHLEPWTKIPEVKKLFFRALLWPFGELRTVAAVCREFVVWYTRHGHGWLCLQQSELPCALY